MNIFANSTCQEAEASRSDSRRMAEDRAELRNIVPNLHD